jgi:tetratricopeptide (TPR) repeat protein
MIVRKPIASLGLASILVVLAGCSTYSLPGQQPPAEVAKPDPTVDTSVRPSEAPSRSTTPSSGHQSLMERAEQAATAGDYEESLALLERAQRINPSDADIYMALAQVHQAMGNTSMAKASAERGLLYCSGGSQCRALRKLAN